MIDYLKNRQSHIIRTKNAREAIEFAKDVPDADIPALQRVIIENGTAWDAAEFASKISKCRGADIGELAQAILDHGNDGFAAYWFTRYVSDAHMQEMQKIVLAHGDGNDAYKFANDIPGADIAALQQVVIQRGNPEDIYDMALEMGTKAGVDVKALERAMLERGDGEYTYWFAHSIPDADVHALKERITFLHEHNVNDGSFDRFNKDPVIQAKLKPENANVAAKNGSRIRV